MRNLLRSLLAVIALALLPSVADAQSFNTYRNLLINGEALVAQPGVATLTGINTTATYGADGWAVFSNNGSASVVAARSTATLPTGFQQAFSLNRTSANTNTTAACFVQEIETAKLIQAQGQPVVFTAYLLGGANFSAAGNTAQVTIITGTGTDQGLSSLIAATWTGQATLVNAQSVAVPLSTSGSYARVGVTATLPATATEAAVEICFTPTGTASTADTLFMTGTQLEVQQGNCPAVPVSAGFVAQSAGAVTCATPYEHKSIDLEWQQAYRYFYQVTEPASGAAVPADCANVSSGSQVCTFPLPVQMLKATPVMNAGGGGITTGTFKLNIAGTQTTWTTPTAGTCSNLACTVTAATTDATVGANLPLAGGTAQTGIVAVSSRF